MPQDNNIENILRDLDDQQQPDLQNMDTHWQQMQTMLQPVSIPVSKSVSTGSIIGVVIVSALLLAGGAFLFYSFNGSGKRNDNNIKSDIAANKKLVIPVLIPIKDTIEKKTVIATVSPATGIEKNAKEYSQYVSEDSSDFSDIKINYTPCNVCPNKGNSNSNILVNRPALLQNLFIQWKKEEQQFVIDNSRDTVFQCAEGSILFIPANSLGGNSGILFSVKEFYKESDIILNQLSTVSNKDQLITGGMLHITASLNGKDVAVNPEKPLQLYMNDTSSAMTGMQLFNGEVVAPVSNPIAGKVETWEEGLMDNASTANINWLPQYQYFSRKQITTEVRVLNIIDQPFKIKQRHGGEIGYFSVDYDSLKMDKDVLKKVLKDKYGYYKVRLRSSVKYRFGDGTTGRDFISGYANNIGDSLWMDKETAERYKLKATARRRFERNEISGVSGERGNAVYYELSQQTGLMDTIQNKYGVSVKTLGWINCDHFSNDQREKIQYAVNLGDSARNYYTLLVFDNIKSMMNGYADGNRVIFKNVPKGESVKVISIGIDKTGEKVYLVQPAIIDINELTGLQFQLTSAAALKAALSKMDR